LNSDHIEEFNNVKTMLERAGAIVILVNQMHSKIITVDDKVIIIGSFNWLSAVRVESSYKREETSLIYKGEKVAELIEEVLGPIRAKSKLPLHRLNEVSSKALVDVASQ
jgi:hypothetical protein